MFGALRTGLAVLVVMQHLAGVSLVGHFAVTGFFCLSGFLMTLLMDGKYRGRIGAFAMNRFLRLYPLYWFFLALTAIMLLIGMRGARGEMHLPIGWEWIPDILYLNYWNEKRMLLPVAWAVTNEIVMYALIAFGISKTMRRSVVWVGVSILYTFMTYRYAPRGSDLYYFAFTAASLPFAVGALTYHLREELPPRVAPWLAAGSTICGCVLLWMLSTKHGDRFLVELAFYFCAAALVMSLYHLRSFASRRIRKLDETIGEVSYPIYLNHYTAAMVVMLWTPRVKDWHFFAQALPVALILAIIGYVLVDRPLKPYRDLVRSGSVKKPDGMTKEAEAAQI